MPRFEIRLCGELLYPDGEPFICAVPYGVEHDHDWALSSGLFFAAVQDP